MGIVGLPNVGKSTLFNAITNAGAECANYPFCTIEPNVGVVPVPDDRLEVLAKMYKTTLAKKMASAYNTGRNDREGKECDRYDVEQLHHGRSGRHDLCGL